MSRSKHRDYESRFDFVAEHARDVWHFDPAKRESGDLRVLGRVSGDWREALKTVTFRPRFSCRAGSEAGPGVTWDKILSDIKSCGKDSSDAHWDFMHARDLAAWGYRPDNVEHETHDGELPEIFRRIGGELLLKDCWIDLNRQRPGQMTPAHTDTRLHEYGLRRVYDGDFSPPPFARLLIALEDWDWGHHCFIGSGVWHQWREGEIAVIPWQAVHGTANCGRRDRFFLSVTGTPTPEFDAWLASGERREIVV